MNGQKTENRRMPPYTLFLSWSAPLLPPPLTDTESRNSLLNDRIDHCQVCWGSPSLFTSSSLASDSYCPRHCKCHLTWWTATGDRLARLSRDAQLQQEKTGVVHCVGDTDFSTPNVKRGGKLTAISLCFWLWIHLCLTLLCQVTNHGLEFTFHSKKKKITRLGK